MKSVILISILIGFYLFSSCSQKPKNGKWEIKTNMVRGAINASGTKVGKNCGSYIERSEEGYNITYDKGCVECDDYTITIDTTYLSFEDYLTRYKNGISIIEEKRADDYCFIYMDYLVNINRTRIGGVTVSADTVYSQGYKFLVYKQGKSKNYILEGDNTSYKSSPPIYDKKVAMRALVIARSFEPAD